MIDATSERGWGKDHEAFAGIRTLFEYQWNRVVHTKALAGCVFPEYVVQSWSCMHIYTCVTFRCGKTVVGTRHWGNSVVSH